MDETIPGKVSGEGTSEQTTNCSALQDSKLLQQCNLCREKALSFFFLLFVPSLFTWIAPEGSKKLLWFFARFISHSIPCSHSISIGVICKENSPCQQNQSSHKWLPEWSSLLIPSANRQCFTRQKGLGEDTRVPIVFPALCCDLSLQLRSKFLILYLLKKIKHENKVCNCICWSSRWEEQKLSSNSFLARLEVSCWSDVIPHVEPPWFSDTTTLHTRQLSRHKHKISLHTGATIRLFCRGKLRGRKDGLGKHTDYNIAFPQERKIKL